MSVRKYSITQDFSDGSSREAEWTIQPFAGTYNVSYGLSNGGYIYAGQIVSDNTYGGLPHKLEVELSDGTILTSTFNSHFGLYPPQYIASEYKRDSSGSYYGKLTITNPNAMAVKCVVWYKPSGYDMVMENGTFTLGAGQTHTIVFADVYSTGLCTRVNFCLPSEDINENDVYYTCVLGFYEGDTTFGAEIESTSTTTTTTTVDGQSAEPTPIESDGKFTLWREANAK